MTTRRASNPETAVIHAGQELDPQTGAVSTPIYQSATFAFRNADQGAALFAGTEPGYIYTRLGNPTVQALETALAELERGCGALATATGMAAVTTVDLALLGRGARVVSTATCYAASRTVLETELSRYGVEAEFVDTSDLAAVRRAVRPGTTLLWLDTPANPTMTLSDIRACAEIGHAAGALVAVDNTFATPILQNPLALGADVVVHSLTKYVNGHSDVVGGAIVARDPDLFARLRKTLRLFGGTMDPHQAWLVFRGLKTLALRVRKAEENARRLAEWLEAHPKIAWVRYPGLASHPQHALAGTQMSGYGAMMSFGVKGGFEAGKRVMDAVRLCTLAVSLGGVESLIEHPASMTHAGVPREEREKAGLTDDLVRLSPGCEAFEDIRDDLAQALEKA